jgi:hypothetical protein
MNAMGRTRLPSLAIAFATLLGAAGPVHAADEPDAPAPGPSYFGLACHGAYVQRADDGSLDCNPYGQALRLSFEGRINSETTGFEEVEFGEVSVLLPGEWRLRERVRYSVTGSWFWTGDDLWDGASHVATVSRWFCAGLGCTTRGEGELHLHLEPDGDITVLRFDWRERWDTPRTLHAGDEAGTLRMGHCPALD